MYAGDEPWRPAVLDVGQDDYYHAHILGCRELAESPYLERNIQHPLAKLGVLRRRAGTGRQHSGGDRVPAALLGVAPPTERGSCCARSRRRGAGSSAGRAPARGTQPLQA